MKSSTIKTFVSLSALAMVLASIPACVKHAEVGYPNLSGKLSLSLKKSGLSQSNLVSPGLHQDGYIVFFKKDIRKDILKNISQRNYNLFQSTVTAYTTNFLNGINLSNVKVRNVYGRFPGFCANLTDEQVQVLKKSDNIEGVWPNMKFQMDLPKPENIYSSNGIVNPNGGVTPMTQTVPWGVTRVGGGTDDANSGIKCWVLDTGCDLDHPDLNVDVTDAASFITGHPSADDDNGHGTFVSGIIGAKNNTIGVIGVAPNAEIVPVKVLDRYGNGSYNLVIQGLNYIYSNAPNTDVINMSIQAPRDTSTVVDQVIIDMASNGYFFSIIAGNYSDDTQFHPMARIQQGGVNIISAIDDNDDFASFSDYGASVSNADPGVDISSTWLNGGYASGEDGTSFAAPHFVALMMLPWQFCGCPCDLTPIQSNDKDYVVNTYKEHNNNTPSSVSPNIGFCFITPARTYAHNDPDGNADQIYVRWHFEFHPFP